LLCLWFLILEDKACLCKRWLNSSWGQVESHRTSTMRTSAAVPSRDATKKTSSETGLLPHTHSNVGRADVWVEFCHTHWALVPIGVLTYTLIPMSIRSLIVLVAPCS
jgi:hypothetical protein